MWQVMQVVVILEILICVGCDVMLFVKVIEDVFFEVNFDMICDGIIVICCDCVL